MNTKLMLAGRGRASRFPLNIFRVALLLLATVGGVGKGYAQVTQGRHLIDLDAAPYVPGMDWTVEEHHKGGQLEWDPTRVRLYYSTRQMDMKYIEGYQLHTELANEFVLNANVLDYLLAHPDLIPEEWKDKAIFFWGTIYRYSDGGLCVRYLCWRGGRWYWYYDWLDHDWDDYSPAAVLAK